jgi:hypothetical protein
MKWMRERDLLIAQTMAFVQSVTGQKPEAEIFARADISEVTPTRLPDVEAMLAEGLLPAEAPKPAASSQPVSAHVAPAHIVSEHVVAEPRPPARPAMASEYRSEIQARVEKFRAHQARFNREREAYCSATMAKMQAALDKNSVPRK